MRVLIACEYSARVRDAFAIRGHDAWSVDLLESDGDPARHLMDDALTVAYGMPWDLMVAFPPCTYLTKSNAWRWDAIERERNEALDFVRSLLAAPIPRIALENPVGAIGTNIRKADQYVQPWQFGDPYQKTTGLWLGGLAPLMPTVPDKPEGVTPWCCGGYGPRKANGSRTVPVAARRKARERSLTFNGIARAMADQWG